MRVRCVKIVNPFTATREASSPWVKVDEEYVVLSLSATHGGRFLVRIMGPDGRPQLWDAEMFVTVASRNPSNWTTSLLAGATVEVGPEAWLVPGFWEAYLAEDAEAVECYEREARQIVAEDGWAHPGEDWYLVE